MKLVLLCFLLALHLAAAAPYPRYTSGTFKGTARMLGMELPYVNYNNLQEEKHMDFVKIPGVGAFMLGAYINGTAYLNSQTGCESFQGEGFPFPADLMAKNNATFIGLENLTDLNAQVEHWSVKFWAMGSYWYADFYLDVASSTGEHQKMYRVIFIGANPDQSSVVFTFDSWNFDPPDDSVFQLPSECASAQ